MSQSRPQYPLAIGEIVKLTGEPLHRIEYLIRTRAIQPVRRVGNVHLYDEEGVERIQRALAASTSHADRSRRLPERFMPGRN